MQLIHFTILNCLLCRVSIDVSLMTEYEKEDLEDPDYEPEFEMTAVL